MRRLLILTGFLLAPAVCHAQFVGTCNANNGGTPTVSCSLAVSANQLIVISAGISTSGTCTPSDGLTLSWSTATTHSVGGGVINLQGIWYAVSNSSTSGSNLFTLTCTANITAGGMWTQTFNNVVQSSPLDGAAAVNSGNSTCVAQTDCTVSITTSNPTDLLLSLWFHNTTSLAGGFCCNLLNANFGGGNEYNIENVAGTYTHAITDGSSGLWQGIIVAFKFISTQSPFLVQSSVDCSTGSTTVTCAYPKNVAAGNGLVIGVSTKRGVTGLNPITISDTMNISGTSGWHCIPLGPDVPQGIVGDICSGFPTSSGPESVTFTFTGGGGITGPAPGLVSEWKPQVFFPCKDSCTLIGGGPSCCLSDVTSIPISTSSTSGYVNNFSVAILANTFPTSCSQNFWTVPSGTAYVFNGRIPLMAYAFQPNTSGTNITMTMHCGSGSTGVIVWGGGLFSSTYFPNNPPRKSQVY